MSCSISSVANYISQELMNTFSILNLYHTHCILYNTYYNLLTLSFQIQRYLVTKVVLMTKNSDY